MAEIELTDPQFELVTTDAQFPAMVAGFGAGKTKALVTRALYKKRLHPKQNIAYYLPTFDLVRQIGFPRFEEELEAMGAKYKLNKVFHTFEIENAGSIIFRSLDQPERIVGYEVADSLVDELDTLKTANARDAWRKIIGRNRQKKNDSSLNTVAVGTTPEGFRFVYEQWGKQKIEGYQLIKASTYSNAHNLPDGYIQSLENSYPASLLAAYLGGEFVNLTSGSVYADFDRELNNTTAKIEKGEPLHIGMDFNVRAMSAIICVIRDGNPMALAELTEVRDTPSMIDLIKQRYAGHSITIYPDASGDSAKSINASISDITLLRNARFTVLAPNSNPRVKDRVMSVNYMIHNQGARKLKVNFDTCPTMVECLEQQSYDKNGEPDKSTGHDHLSDALGYFINYKFGIGKGKLGTSRVIGL